MINGCRISHQLRDYSPRHFGISSFSATRCHRSFLNFKLVSNASFSSSSSLADNSGDFAGIPYANSDSRGQHVSEVPLVSDQPVFRPPENGTIPPTEEVTSVAGGIVALGKFDALHIGHRELAIQASKIGVPYLLSLVGMAEVLGWEPRAPIVAKCDRKRVLSSWAPLCNNMIPKEYHVEFSKVRHLTPQQFVEKLSKELGVHGVVAGQNYRFGYKASGNTSDLVQLCEVYGIEACIIRSVMDSNRQSSDKVSTNSQDQGQVSSTRVRYALSIGDMKYVSQLLGRRHRLVLTVNKQGVFYSDDREQLSVPKSCSLNLLPTEGLYNNCLLILDDENAIRCRVVIDTTDIHLELDELAPCTGITPQTLEFLSIEFGDSKA